MNPTVSQLRAVSADPVRLDLLEALRDAGEPLTSAALEKRVPTARGSINSHLQRLADAGWIDQVGNSRGRNATWVTSSDGVAWSDTASADPDVALAIDELYWVAQQRRINRIRAFDAQRQERIWSQEWVDAATGLDSLVHLTAEDLDDFADDFEALLARYRARGRNAGPCENSDGDGVQRVFVTLAAFPVRFGG